MFFPGFVDVYINQKEDFKQHGMNLLQVRLEHGCTHAHTCTFISSNVYEWYFVAYQFLLLHDKSYAVHYSVPELHLQYLHRNRLPSSDLQCDLTTTYMKMMRQREEIVSHYLEMLSLSKCPRTTQLRCH